MEASYPITLNKPRKQYVNLYLLVFFYLPAIKVPPTASLIHLNLFSSLFLASIRSQYNTLMFKWMLAENCVSLRDRTGMTKSGYIFRCVIIMETACWLFFQITFICKQNS